VERPEGKPEGKYIYCLFAAREPHLPGLSGIGGYDVYTLHFKDLAAAVSNTPAVYYEPVQEHVMAHQKVISAIMKKYEVLPVVFGTICKSEQELYDLLKKIYARAKENLNRIKDKIEVGLKVFWGKEAFLQEMGEANPQIIRLRKEINAAGKDVDTYAMKLRLGQLVEEQTQKKRQSYLQVLYRPLLVYAADARLNEPIMERMILNAAFLIRKEQEAEFDQAVNNIYQRFKDRLIFKYTGPWPPYNFIEMKITEG